MSNIKETVNNLNTIIDITNETVNELLEHKSALKDPTTPILKELDSRLNDVNKTASKIKEKGIELIPSSDKIETEIKNEVLNVKENIKSSLGSGVNAVMNYLSSQKDKIENLVSKENITSSNNSSNTNHTPNKFMKESVFPEDDGSKKHTNNRVRKIDRKNLFSELCSELPITLKYTEGNLDGNDTVHNYAHEWKQWYEVDEVDELKELIEELKKLEEKYKIMGTFNNNVDKGIQFSLLVLGSGVVYVEASKASTEVISKWNIVAGALTTFATIVYNFFKFDKKGPHYTMTSNNIRKLRSWIEGKMILPIDKRYSPFDIYSISFKAYQTIIEEAESINQSSK
jgi:hypothetical protein